MRPVSRPFSSLLSSSLLSALVLAPLAGCSATPSGVSTRLDAATPRSAMFDAAAVAGEALPNSPSFVIPLKPQTAQPAVTHGNSAQLHVFPTETLPALKSLITSARHSLYLEAHNFGNDSYGRQIVPMLIAKAKAGVDVRLNLDYVGSRFLKGHKDMVSELRRGGVEVRIYPARMMVREDGTRSFNLSHRKLYLADGEHALVGGVNLMAPFDSTTQDLLIDWRGPIVGQLYAEFAHDWKTAGGKPLTQEIPAPDAVAGEVDAQIAVTGPDEGRFEARDAIFNAIDGAEREILVQQQYFWDDAMIERFHAALKRGVKLRVLVPGGHQKLVQKTCNSEALRALVAEGAEARHYRGLTPEAHLHTKYFSVDDRWAITGSVNGDARSFHDNQELDIITTDARLISELRTRLFEADWENHSEPFKYVPGGWVTKRFRTLVELLDYYF